MIDLLHTILLGIIEGITEFYPSPVQDIYSLLKAWSGASLDLFQRRYSSGSYSCGHNDLLETALSLSPIFKTGESRLCTQTSHGVMELPERSDFLPSISVSTAGIDYTGLHGRC